MIDFGAVWGIARAELRLSRRLVRYWVFLSIAALLAAANYAQFHFIHYFFSPRSASAAAANPHFFFANFGTNFVLMFLVGIVFLGFDVRARDVRERMVEVLDALPVTNVELLLGRALGLWIACWVPVVVLTLLIAFVGFLLGNSIEPWSAVAVLFFMAPPGFLFTIGLVYLLTVLLRHRLLASLVGVAVLALCFFVSLFWFPLWSMPIVDVTGGFDVQWSSDLMRSLIDGRGVVQRIGYLLLGLGLLLLAAAAHPRKDDSGRLGRAGAGLGLAVVAALLIVGTALQQRGWIEERKAWLAAHEAHRDDAVPDLQEIRGDVRIDPGDRLAIGVDLRFRAPADESLDRALFTLNPGMHVESIEAGGGKLEFTHENGLLEVALPRTLAPGEETTIHVAAAGLPDAAFCYLDAVVDPLELKGTEAQVILLGYEPYLFRKQHVTLLPGVRWLPASGGEAGRNDSATRPTDFYEIDLAVDVPEGWLVAGPGRRRPLDGAEPGRARFEFAPGGYVPQVALVAGRYESRTMEVDGVLLEALLHPSHIGNVDFYADAAGEVQDWLAERLDEADSIGLDYPYDALTLVEVPQILRGYGGGWRQDSTLIQPGMILMRESGFPTARFDAAKERFERAKDREGGVARAKREALETFFENDINGGNPFIAAARSFFGFQTAGVGPEAVPLDFVWENLSSEVLAEHTGYFSIHFFDQRFGQTFAEAAQGMRNEDRVADSYAGVLIHMLTSTPAIWDTTLGTSLVELDPWKDPEKTVNVLGLKGGAMARSLLDALGREKAGQFLAALRRRTAGGSFTREDVVAAGQEVGEDLERWLELWIDETDLPGFTLGDVGYFRLPDGDDGSLRYQVKVVVQNEEEPPGLMRLEYRTEADAEAQRFERETSEPVLVPGRSAVEVGLTTSSPMRSLKVAPYFALNRDAFAVPLPALDTERIVEAEPFVGNQEVAWAPRQSPAIVVDDLDDGFSLEESDERGMLRVAGRGEQQEELDQGIPVSNRGWRPPRWSRVSASDAFGKYRRTMAVVGSGEGQRHAVFTAELPRSGSWQLEYHMPQRPTGRTSRHPGTWNLTVTDANGDDRDLTFDADGSDSGWNSLGTFDVAAGEIRVRVSDGTDGDYVVADAIRWVPVADVASRTAS